ARDDHEVVGDPSLLARPDLRTEVLDCILRLDDVVAEKGIFLEADVVLDHGGGYAELVERAHGELEMLGLAARVRVVNDRFRRDLEQIVQRLRAGRDVYRLDVRFPFGGGLREAARPDAVELAARADEVEAGICDDESGQAVVGFHQAHQGLRGQQTAKLVAANVRRDADLLDRLVQLSRRDTLRIRNLDELAAPLLEHPDHGLSHLALDALSPVVTVDDVVGAIAAEIGNVVEGLLGHDPRDALQVLDDRFPLLVGHEREALVAGNSGVGEQADRYLSELVGPFDDVQMARMDQIGAHRDVNLLGRLGFRRLSAHSSSVHRVQLTAAVILLV